MSLTGHMAPLSGHHMCLFVLCYVLDSPRGFLRGRHAQEGAGRMAASGPEVALLARACLRSDDNHV